MTPTPYCFGPTEWAWVSPEWARRWNRPNGAPSELPGRVYARLTAGRDAHTTGDCRLYASREEALADYAAACD